MQPDAPEIIFDPQRPLSTLMRFYGKERYHLIFAIIFYVIKQSPQWLLPILSATLIDIVASAPQHYLVPILGLATLMTVDVAQNIPTHYLYMRHLSIATRSLEKHLRYALAQRLQYLSMHFYHGRDIGSLQTKVIRDVEMVQQTIQLVWDGLPATIIGLIIALVVTAIRAPWFLIFYVLTVPISATLIVRSRAKLQQRNQQFRQNVEAVSARVSEMLRMLPLTRAHGSEQEEIQRVEVELERLRMSGRKLDSVNAVFGATSWVSLQFFNAFCLIVLCLLALTHLVPMSVGTIVLLTGFYQGITTAAIGLMTLIPQINKGLESFASLGEILAEDDLERNKGKMAVTQVNGHVRFDHVTYTYPHAATPSLDDASLDILPGQMVALVGPSGAGKTTLINLLIGFLRPEAGQIFLDDDQDLETLDMRSFRRFLGVVPQETVLFHGTIRDNVLYGASSCSEARYQQAITDAQILEFLDRLPEGDQTLIGPNGTTLSGGQRQRIAIARALIRDPQVLILDEATAALDAQSELLVQQALTRLFHHRTTLVIAHRLSTIAQADRIIVLDQGRIVEQGTHAELIARHGAYALMHAANLA